MRSLVYFNPRRNPLTTRELFSEFDSFFNDFSPMTKNWLNEEDKALTMGSSVEETDKAYLLSVDLPGVKPEDIHLDVDKNRVHIRAERKKEMRNGSNHSRSFGQYSETFTVPDEVNAENIEAHFENGVLTLALPKETKAQKKTIQIQHGQESKGLLERWFTKSETPAEKKIN